MKRYTPLLAASLLLAAIAPLQTRAADNTWNNGSTDFLWNGTSLNWAAPTTWVDGDNAVFDVTGAGTVTLGAPISVQNQTFNAAGYTVAGGGNALTLAGTTPTITVNADSTNAASLYGTAGLTVQGTGTLVLQGDSAPDGNYYTGGTFVRSGTLILQVAGASSSGAAYAVDSIEALDAGATVKMGSTFNGTSWAGPARDQIAANSTAFASHLIMTGGTLDLNNDPKTQRVPIPDGTGLIINTGPDVQSGLQIIADGQDHTFSGVIADGNNGVLVGDNSGQGPGYQIGIVNINGAINGGGGVWTLSGSNTYSGSTRIQTASIKLAGAGTLGFPTPNGLTGPLRIYGPYYLDLNGTSQTIALMQNGNADAKVFNSAVDTVSTLTFGFGNEQVARNASYQFMDHPGTGGILALTKIGTNCIQTLSGVNTYSGDTTVSEGILAFSVDTAVSPNTSFKLFTTGGTLLLSYVGDVSVRSLYIDGVRLPAGTYGAGTAPIDPTSTGTITVSPPNIWNNASTDFQWNETSANWTSPTTWAYGREAIFGATGAGPVDLTTPVAAHSLTFNAAGYVITSAGGQALTLIDSGATITANADSSIAASIIGTAGLTFQGTSSLVLLGDAGLPDGNHYTGGTYVKSGTLILRAAGVSTSGAAYAVDNIEAIDAGAKVQIGTENDGTTNVRPPDGQLLRGNNLGRLNLTGGTFDNNGDDNGIQYPCPEGTGTIVNSSPYKRAVMKLQGGNTGKTYVFNGQIKDGGLNVTTSQGTAYQQNIDMNGNSYTLVLGGSNSFTGFIRQTTATGNRIILTNNGTLGYPPPINQPARHILMNAGFIDLNGTSQKVGYVYTGNNQDSIITNGAFGTVSTLTVCFNATNLVAFNGAATPRGIRNGLRDDPTVSGTLALTKEGVAIQPIGTYSGDDNVGPNAQCNYHGDTTVNNGILEVVSTTGISPNSAYRLNTAQGNLQLDYAGTAPVKGLYINGVQMPNGIYGSETAPITGTGFIQVAGSSAPPVIHTSIAGGSLTFSWPGGVGSFKLQAQTNSLTSSWFDYPGGGSNPLSAPIDPAQGAVFFRLAPAP